jgi:hypothetical protein
MTPKTSSQVLYDSDSVLRLVDAAIEGMGITPTGTPSENAQSSPTLVVDSGVADRLVEVQGSLAFGYQAILKILGALRQGRGSIEAVASDRLHPAHEKLQEVTNTTEVAATDILVGIEECLAMVDRLDEVDGAADRSEGVTIRSDMRNKLFDLMNHLQFQDITRQQLNFASSVLLDTEQHLAQIAAAIEPTAAPLPMPPIEDRNKGTYDPRATTQNAAERQAVADQVVAARTDHR